MSEQDIPRGLRRFDIPLEFAGLHNTIDLNDALHTPLANAFGTEVIGIENKHQLNQLFKSQAEFLLQDCLYGQNLDESYINFAMRIANKDYKHDEQLWAGDDETGASARILFPYSSPSVSYMEVEKIYNKPARITYGLKRQLHSGIVRYARTIFWLEKDTQRARNDNRLRVRKSTIGSREFISLDECDEYLNRTKRVASKSFRLLQILGEID